MPTLTTNTPMPHANTDSSSAALSAVSFATQSAVASTSLLGDDGLCIIEHNAERYVLRRTRNNRLILTK
jgi:hemin uptake protein HemP